MQQWKEAQRNYLATLIQQEIAKILETAGLNRGARVGTCCAALGCSFGQVWAQARESVREQILRPAADIRPGKSLNEIYGNVKPLRITRP